MKDIDKQISEIDAKLAKLEKEEGNIKEKPKRKPLNQTKEAIETIRECVNEILEIDDLKSSRELDKKLRENTNRFEFLESIDISECKNIIYWEYNKLLDDYDEDEEGIPEICDIFYYVDYMNDIIIPKYK